MTVAAWIQHLQKLDPGLEVIVRIEGDEGMYTAEKVSIIQTFGCDDAEFVAIDGTDGDEGVVEAGS